MATDGRSYQELLYTPAIVVASVTAVLYLIGYLYYVSFFNRLSIPYGSINLSVSQCITAALLPISSLIVGGIVLFILNSSEFKNKFERMGVRIVVLLISIIIGIIIFAYPQMWISSVTSITIVIIILLVLFLLVINSFFPIFFPYSIALTVFILFTTPNDISSDLDISMGMVLLKMFVGLLIVVGTYMDITSTESKILSNIDKIRDTKFLPMMFLIAVLSVSCFSTIMGLQNADYVVEGVSADALKINISLKDENNTMFENKTPILVMIHDDTYYIIEKDESHSKEPKVYIIPSDQIKLAVVYEQGRGWFSDIISQTVDDFVELFNCG